MIAMLTKPAGAGNGGAKLFLAGKYLTGHPEMDRSEPICIGFNDTAAVLYALGTEGRIFNMLTFSTVRCLIPLAAIEEVRSEDAASMEGRLTGRRLRDLGFIGGKSRRKMHPPCYVTIYWRWDTATQETVFELPTLRKAHLLKDAFDERLARRR